MNGGSRSRTGRTGIWVAAAVALCLALLGLRTSVTGVPAARADTTPVVTPTDAPSPDPTDPPSSPVTPDPTGPTEPPSPTPSDPAPPPPPAGPAPTTPADAIDAGTTGPSVAVGAFVFARLDRSCVAPDYLKADAVPDRVAPFDIVRIRFRVDSSAAPGAATTLAPQLEYRLSGTGPFRPVVTRPTRDEAFALEAECRVVRTAHGRRTETLSSSLTIVPSAFRLQGAHAGSPVRGEHETGANPAPDLTLPAGAGSEQEFTIRAGLDLAPEASYEFRLTDAGTALPGVTAALRTAAKDRTRLSPGQRSGRDVRAPSGSVSQGRTAAYPLVVRRSALTSLGAARAAAVTAGDTIHGPYGMVTDQCSACHRAHTAAGPSLVPTAGPTSTLCLTCHNGTGAAELDVAAQYAAARPNDPATGSYYQHDALSTSTHTLASENEFGGVSNRHSECVDCHNPHQANSAPAAPGADGWTSSGLLAGDSGVAVTNGAAGTPPTYTFLEGAANPVTLEYQLCFKCHSGFTELRPNDPDHPSWDALDKGIELNPANASYHPVEAAGTNQTAAMAASLAGTSPYKTWDFPTTATIRCENCHANGAIAPGGPAASATLSDHGSANRGLLLRPYRDRELLGPAEGYSAGNFALCYSCHAEEPYLNSSSTATDFDYHAYHVSDPDFQEWSSGGTDIDTAGAGQSNAVCAECHYRLHSTTFKTGDQDVNGARLVNFAPDAQPWIQYNPDGSVRSVTPPTWTQRPAWQGGGGTCTLVCHGKVHDRLGY